MYEKRKNVSRESDIAIAVLDCNKSRHRGLHDVPWEAGQEMNSAAKYCLSAGARIALGEWYMDSGQEGWEEERFLVSLLMKPIIPFQK